LVAGSANDATIIVGADTLAPFITIGLIAAATAYLHHNRLCCAGRLKQCDEEFSRAKSAAVKAGGKKAAGAVYAEHAMSFKRAGKVLLLPWSFAASASKYFPYSSTAHSFASGNTGRAEQLLIKAISKDGRLSVACVLPFISAADAVRGAFNQLHRWAVTTLLVKYTAAIFTPRTRGFRRRVLVPLHTMAYSFTFLETFQQSLNYCSLSCRYQAMHAHEMATRINPNYAEAYMSLAMLYECE
jgi:hypothetical protein